MSGTCYAFGQSGNWDYLLKIWPGICKLMPRQEGLGARGEKPLPVKKISISWKLIIKHLRASLSEESVDIFNGIFYIINIMPKRGDR